MKFKLIEKFEIPPKDYGTGKVNGDDIFDKYTHTSFYDNLIKEPEYMKEKHNLKGEIIKMSPNEYFSTCAYYIFNNSSVEALKNERGSDKKTLEYLTKLITEYKIKWFLPYINLAENPQEGLYKSQEGLHRMYVAGELFGWDHKFPVLVVTFADKEKQKEIEQQEKQKEIEDTISFLKNTVDWVLQDEYKDLKEFESILDYNLDDCIIEKGDLHYKVYFKNLPEAVYEFNISDVKLIKENYSDLDDDVDNFFIADLTESKKDLEKFRLWAGEDLYNRFIKLKPRLTGKERDIYFWMDKDIVSDNLSGQQLLSNSLDALEKVPTRKQRDEKGKEGAELIYEDNDWKVYHILSYEGAIHYGKGTKWCITGKNTGTDEDDIHDYVGGKDYWNSYSSTGNQFYFFIPKHPRHNKEKYALDYSPSNNYWTLFDEEDWAQVGSWMDYKKNDSWNPFDASQPHFPNVKGLPDINAEYERAKKELEYS